MLDEAKTNGHAEPATRAWDARLARLERRLADIAEIGEQRVMVLRDAIADFAASELARRDAEIVSLKKQLADLQQKLEQQAAIDQRVHEISARLEEKQARRDRGKNGITDGDIIQTMDMVIAQERQSARKEFKAADEEMQRAFEAKLAEQKERLLAVPGRLPVAKIWRQESVTYEGEVVSYDGALYQARKDTAQIPGGSDWVCVARPAVMAAMGERRTSAERLTRMKHTSASMWSSATVLASSQSAIIQELALPVPEMAGNC
jgi:chromosome segregation ATPase